MCTTGWKCTVVVAESVAGCSSNSFRFHLFLSHRCSSTSTTSKFRSARWCCLLLGVLGLLASHGTSPRLYLFHEFSTELFRDAIISCEVVAIVLSRVGLLRTVMNVDCGLLDTGLTKQVGTKEDETHVCFHARPLRRAGFSVSPRYLASVYSSIFVLCLVLSKNHLHRHYQPSLRVD